MDKKTEAPVNLGEAISYPFNKWQRCYNFLWIFTIIGIVPLCGYLVRIVQELIKGNKKELPKFNFGDDMSKGWKVLGYVILLGLVCGIISSITTSLSIVLYVVWSVYLMLISPMLFIQFAENRKIEDGFNIVKANKLVFMDFGEYVVMILKSIVQNIVYFFAFILLFVGVGASMFGKYYLFADYYRRHVKNL